jgi:hypothetical protein
MKKGPRDASPRGPKREHHDPNCQERNGSMSIDKVASEVKPFNVRGALFDKKRLDALYYALRSIPDDEREQAIAGALARLAEEERRVTLISRFEDLDTSEMARLLGDLDRPL